MVSAKQAHIGPSRRVARASGALSALWLLAGLHGCDDGAPLPRDVSCARFCEKLELCDDATDVAGCEQHCSGQRVRSDAYLEARAQCAEARSCNTFTKDIGVMGEDLCGREECTLNDCTSDDLAHRPRTSTQQSYCASITSKLKACDPSIEPALLEGHCLELVPTLSDEYLGLVSGCIEGDCSQVRACVRSAADRYNTDVTPAPRDWLAPES
jgi:hypothetical protein